MAGRTEKYAVGERVEMLCYHRRGAERVHDWLSGEVVQVDQRLAAVKLSAEVYANTGWPIPDRILWAAHGSRNLRRPE